MFVKFSGNIPEIQWGCCGGLFTLVKPILQLMFSLPSKLALLMSLDHPTCDLAAAAAYQLSVPENCFMSSKNRDLNSWRLVPQGQHTKGISGACWWLSLNLSEALFARWIFFKNLQEHEVCFISVPEGKKEKKSKSAPLFLVGSDEHIQDALIWLSFFKTCPMPSVYIKGLKTGESMTIGMMNLYGLSPWVKMCLRLTAVMKLTGDDPMCAHGHHGRKLQKPVTFEGVVWTINSRPNITKFARWSAAIYHNVALVHTRLVTQCNGLNPPLLKLYSRAGENCPASKEPPHTISRTFLLTLSFQTGGFWPWPGQRAGQRVGTHNCLWICPEGSEGYNLALPRWGPEAAESLL